jgi:hypothetical protein
MCMTKPGIDCLVFWRDLWSHCPIWQLRRRVEIGVQVRRCGDGDKRGRRQGFARSESVAMNSPFFATHQVSMYQRTHDLCCTLLTISCDFIQRIAVVVFQRAKIKKTKFHVTNSPLATCLHAPDLHKDKLYTPRHRTHWTCRAAKSGSAGIL